MKYFQPKTLHPFLCVGDVLLKRGITAEKPTLLFLYGGVYLSPYIVSLLLASHVSEHHPPPHMHLHSITNASLVTPNTQQEVNPVSPTTVTVATQLHQPISIHSIRLRPHTRTHVEYTHGHLICERMYATSSPGERQSSLPRVLVSKPAYTTMYCDTGHLFSVCTRPHLYRDQLECI